MIVDTTKPYSQVDRGSITYTVCRKYDHISRYQSLRQLIHNEVSSYTALESNNPIFCNIDVIYHTVSSDEENRLDLIAYRYLGVSSYSWVLAYINGITDGYTVHVGERIKVPKNFTDLFNSGEMFAPISAMVLNLGTE